MDAVNALGASLQRAQVMFDNSATRLASADLPTAVGPDATSPAAPDPSNNIDVSEQLTTMMVAADAHHLSAAAMRVALSMYQDSVQLVNTDS